MHPAICSICETEFEPHFSYQREALTEGAIRGSEQSSTVAPIASLNGAEPKVRYFCSQACLEASHVGRADKAVPCAACGADFTVELALQVLFRGGQRRYACTQACRDRLLHDARRPRLGTLVSDTELSDVREKPGNPNPSYERERPLPRVLAIFNQKGGTGKTTTAVSLAAGLALRGSRVLLIDTDPQGNVAASLGLEPARGLYHVLVLGMPIRDAVCHPRPGLDVLAGNEMLAAAELFLAGKRQRDRFLAAHRDEVRKNYDFVILDCSPSLSLLNQNALVMADAVLCPVSCDYLSLVGVRQVIRTIRHVNKLLEHQLDLFGVLPTHFDGRVKLCREALGTLREFFGERCLPPIRAAIRVKEAPAHKKTLFEYAPESSAAEDYQKVVDRLLMTERVETADMTRAAASLGGVA